MSDYDLYYWSVPFRGQFVRAVLAFAGRTWTEADYASISQLMSEPVEHMPVPFMGPPVLIDYGDAYCGGEIGASLKKVLSA